MSIDGQCLETKTKDKREEKRKETNKVHGMVKYIELISARKIFKQTQYVTSVDILQSGLYTVIAGVHTATDVIKPRVGVVVRTLLPPVGPVLGDVLADGHVPAHSW